MNVNDELLKKGFEFSYNTIMSYSRMTNFPIGVPFTEIMKTITVENLTAEVNKLLTSKNFDEMHKSIINIHYKRIIFIMANLKDKSSEAIIILLLQQRNFKDDLCLFVISYLFFWGERYGIADNNCSNITINSLVQTFIFLYFNKASVSSLSIASIVHYLIKYKDKTFDQIEVSDKETLIGFFITGYNYTIKNKQVTIGYIFNFNIPILCEEKKEDNRFCNELLDVSKNMMNNVDFIYIFRKYNGRLIFRKYMLPYVERYLMLFVRPSIPIILKNTKQFDIVEMEKYYYIDGDNTRYDTLLYKGMDYDKPYDSFQNFERPSWYSVKKVAMSYVNNPVDKTMPLQHLYTFKLFKNIRLFPITIPNLLLLKEKYGNTNVFHLYTNEKEWIDLVDKYRFFYNPQINLVDAGNVIKCNHIIDYAFFNSKDYTKIVRKSIFLFDIAFIKCICLYLNTAINVANDVVEKVRDKIRVVGYIAGNETNYKNSAFEGELALCSPYKVLERVDDNSMEDNSSNWDVTNNNFEHIYLNYWTYIEEWAYNQTLIETSKKIVLQPEMIKQQIDEWKSFTANMSSFNNIKCDMNCTDNKSFIDFTELFLKRLFYNISQHPYKLIEKELIHYIPFIVWRSNHGSVHHMRSIKLSLKVYEIFKRNNKKLFKEMLPTKRHIIAAILAPVFVSLARIDEDNKQRGSNGLFHW